VAVPNMNSSAIVQEPHKKLLCCVTLVSAQNKYTVGVISEADTARVCYAIMKLFGSIICVSLF